MQGVDNQQRQVRIHSSIFAKVQVHHFLHNIILGVAGLSIHDRCWQELRQVLTSTISLNKRDTSIPSVMYAITFLITSRLRLLSFSLLTDCNSCERQTFGGWNARLGIPFAAHSPRPSLTRRSTPADGFVPVVQFEPFASTELDFGYFDKVGQTRAKQYFFVTL